VAKRQQPLPSKAALLLRIPRGGAVTANVVKETASSSSVPSVVQELVGNSLSGLSKYMVGNKADTLILLAVTALNQPICTQLLQLSPILGFLGLGLLLGPNGANVISNVHQVEHLADLGIVLFLFEMGLHIDFKTLVEIKTDVFGIGGTQFGLTAVAILLFCKNVLNMSTASSLIVGWSLALSSSAFVMQLLKDKKETNSKYGRSSFGTLLLQDLMVVPLLVMTPLLAGNSDSSVGTAIAQAFTSIVVALVAILGIFGKGILNPVLDFVTKSSSKEALMGVILMSVLGGSFLTEGLGLSNTLGAFLMGMLVAETKHKHTIEHEIALPQGILVGLFFFTVGFEIDLGLVASSPFKILGIVAALMATKAAIATAACRMFGIPMATAQRVGLVLSQGGEFAFVAFRTARAAGILSDDLTRWLLTIVSLTMVCTPALEELGSTISKRMEPAVIQTKNRPMQRAVVQKKKVA